MGKSMLTGGRDRLKDLDRKLRGLAQQKKQVARCPAGQKSWSSSSGALVVLIYSHSLRVKGFDNAPGGVCGVVAVKLKGEWNRK